VFVQRTVFVKHFDKCFACCW